MLLNKLTRINLGNLGPTWRALAAKRWSKFDSHNYELAIHYIKTVQHLKPTWMIERLWGMGLKG